MFELAFRPAPFGVARTSTCSCDACRGNDHEYEFDEEEFEDDFEVCPECGQAHELESDVKLRDIVIDPPKPGVYGKASTKGTEGESTEKRCKEGHTCPIVKGMRAVTEIDGVPFEYVGDIPANKKKKKPAIDSEIWDKSSQRWVVNEPGRLKNRTLYMLPRTAAGIANCLANMSAVGLPVEVLLTMGSYNCRCTNAGVNLSNHSYGDAYDFAGMRLTDGREFLVANTMCDPDTAKIMHRVNACLRLSFPHVMDYYEVNKWPYKCAGHMPKGHWNHFHCDSYNGKNVRWYMGKKSASWRFVRKSLGLKPTGGPDDECKEALKAFAGSDAFDSAAKRVAALSKLYMREARGT